MARRGTSAVVVVLLALLGGCASAPSGDLTPPRTWAAPAAAGTDPLADYVDARLDAMTLEQKIASLLMVHVPGTEPAPIRSSLAATGAAGVIFMGDNVASHGQLAATAAALDTDPGFPVLTAIDQEGGVVRRLPDTGPGAGALRGLDPALAVGVFRERAALVASAGVRINFGIVADVTGDRGSFIHSRVLGTDAAAAAPRVAAAVAGERDLVMSTLKHFPGHGAVAGDSHSSVPTTTMSLDEWRTTQAPPFHAGIEAGAEFVMLGHVRYSAVDDVPASLSPAWIAILRDELGFDGIVVTDDMSMLERSGEGAYADQAGNAVAAIAAGATLLLYVGPVDVPTVVGAIAESVRGGRIPVSTIDDAASRLLELRRGLSDRVGPYIHCSELCRELLG